MPPGIGYNRNFQMTKPSFNSAPQATFKIPQFQSQFQPQFQPQLPMLPKPPQVNLPQQNLKQRISGITLINGRPTKLSDLTRPQPTYEDYTKFGLSPPSYLTPLPGVSPSNTILPFNWKGGGLANAVNAGGDILKAFIDQSYNQSGFQSPYNKPLTTAQTVNLGGAFSVNPSGSLVSNTAYSSPPTVGISAPGGERTPIQVSLEDFYNSGAANLPPREQLLNLFDSGINPTYQFGNAYGAGNNLVPFVNPQFNLAPLLFKALQGRRFNPFTTNFL